MEFIIPKKSQSGEEARRFWATRHKGAFGFEIGFGVGVQQGIPQTNQFDDSIELVRAEAFNESLVEWGGSVVDDLIKDQRSRSATGHDVRTTCAYLSPQFRDQLCISSRSAR